MSVHEQFADDLSLYAMGALQGEERLSVEKHLKDCPDCRQELVRLQGDLALLAFSAGGPRPPARSRERLTATIAREPRRTAVRLMERKRWWIALQWAAAAATVTVILLLLRQNTDLRQNIASLDANSRGQREQLLQAKELIATLTSADAVHFTLVAAKTPPQPQGKAIYLRSTGTLVFLASNLPELPPQKTYELWLIPTSGAPMPAGLFRPDTHGSATVIKPPLPMGVEAKTFAITVEPESGSAAPTSTPIMVGIEG
jgi:anti-sigma-K factor RskA